MTPAGKGCGGGVDSFPALRKCQEGSGPCWLHPIASFDFSLVCLLFHHAADCSCSRRTAGGHSHAAVDALLSSGAPLSWGMWGREGRYGEVRTWSSTGGCGSSPFPVLLSHPHQLQGTAMLSPEPALATALVMLGHPRWNSLVSHQG